MKRKDVGLGQFGDRLRIDDTQGPVRCKLCQQLEICQHPSGARGFWQGLRMRLKDRGFLRGLGCQRGGCALLGKDWMSPRLLQDEVAVFMHGEGMATP